MGYEIDYIPVGDGERAGDAIAIRYGNLSLGAPRDEQIVMVIDGGTKDSGAELVNRVLTHYQTDRVNYVFSTHLDNDHLSGLTVVLDNLKVDGLYMHLPWNHASETNELFKGNFTDSKLEQTLKKSLDTVHEVEELARQKNIPVIEPFAGMSVNNNIVILGPTKEYYELLLCQFREAPEMRKSALQEAIEMVKKVIKAAEEGVRIIADRLDIDLLNDDEQTSAENNSSLILLMQIEGQKVLFTGDAGIPALTAAADLSEQAGIFLSDLEFLHVPHHGSKHNLGSSILKRITAKSAIVSGAKDSNKHPSKRITNALKKHGTSVTVVRGTAILHHYNAPPRQGWRPVAEEPFYDSFEE